MSHQWKSILLLILLINHEVILVVHATNFRLDRSLGGDFYLKTDAAMASSFLESESRIRLRESMSVKMKLKMAHQIRSFVHELIELNLAKESVETPNKKEALQLVKKTTEEAKERQDHNFKPTPICSCMAKELLFRITKSLPYKSNCEGVTCFKYDKFVANPLYFYFKKQQWQLATTPELGMCTRKTTFSCGKNTDCNPDHSEGKPCKGKCKCDTDWINSCECAGMMR